MRRFAIAGGAHRDVPAVRKLLQVFHHHDKATLYCTVLVIALGRFLAARLACALSILPSKDDGGQLSVCSSAGKAGAFLGAANHAVPTWRLARAVISLFGMEQCRGGGR